MAGRGLRVADVASVVVVVAALRTVLAAAVLAADDLATAFFADLTAVLADAALETVLRAVPAFGAALALDAVVVR